jgi:hypothetical protein
VLLAVLLFLAAPDLDSAARELARKIANAVRSREVVLTVQNASSLSEAEVAQVSTELRAHAPRSGGESVAVTVTLSEDILSYLWVAQIQQDVVMLSVPRPAAPAVPTPHVAIQKKLLWEQDGPILDAGMAGPILLVLDAAGISLYSERQLLRSFPLPRPLPRDPRGRLIIDRDSFRAFLPGVTCTGSITAMTCADSTAPWPLDASAADLAPGRNYFTELRLPPFFSTATLAGRRLLAGVDGRTRIYDGTLREIGQLTGWGSDIAAVESGCRNERVALASRPADVNDSDAIQAYDISPSAVQPAEVISDPVPFPGPVTALWPSPEPNQATAIARNLETGRYAAYSLAITCDR